MGENLPKLKVTPLESRVKLVDASNMEHDFPVHLHHSLVIGLVIHGERLISFPDGDSTIRSRQIFIIHPGEPHACHLLENNPTDYRVISIPETLLGSLFSTPRLFPHSLDDPQAVESLENCFTALDNADEDSVRESILTAFILEFAGLWSTPTQFVRQPVSVQKTRLLLEQNKTQKIDIQTLSRAIALSPYHLNRLFRRQTGLSPHNFHLQEKIRQAQAMLAAGSSPAQTALDLGFFDQSHFSRNFTKYVGVSPARFQRQNRKKDLPV